MRVSYPSSAGAHALADDCIRDPSPLTPNHQREQIGQTCRELAKAKPGVYIFFFISSMAINHNKKRGKNRAIVRNITNVIL